MLAQKFNVYKVPCFLVFGPDGKEKSRDIFLEDTAWSAVAQSFQKALSQ
jgi:hypothetical protein